MNNTSYSPAFLLFLCLLMVWVVAGCSSDSKPEANTTTQPGPKPITAPTQVEQRNAPVPTTPPAPIIPPLASELKKLCETPDSLPAPFSSIRNEVIQVVLERYHQREYQPYWFDEETFKVSQAASAIKVFKMANSHGLNPSDYLPDALRNRVSQQKQAAKKNRLPASALTDLALTICVTALAYDLHLGSIPHQAVVNTWDGVDKAFDAEPLLSHIGAGESPSVALERYAPQHNTYQQLRQALATYRKIAKQGGWDPIDPSLLNQIKDRELEKGSHALVPLLRERLIREGYTVTSPENPDTLNLYDESLKTAMKQFQGNRGLHQDGIVGPNTLKSLNVPVEELIGKIIWSMDRWRWLPESMGDRFLLVNLPEYILRGFQAGEQELRMRVVVGDSVKGTHTPLFADEMEYVIFRPYWNVPKSIIEGELLPEIKKDRNYVSKYNYEIVDRFGPNAEVFKPSGKTIKQLENGELKIRQTTGAYNALGLVKFIFPNKYSVYLHDTNQRSLFVHAKRDFSHGCIRVHEPEALARFALPPERWNEEKIHAAMYDEGAERQMVFIAKKIPVYIFYLTAFPNASKSPIGFFEDLYHLDAKMAAYDQKPIEAIASEQGTISAQLP